MAGKRRERSHVASMERGKKAASLFLLLMGKKRKGKKKETQIFSLWGEEKRTVDKGIRYRISFQEGEGEEKRTSGVYHRNKGEGKEKARQSPGRKKGVHLLLSKGKILHFRKKGKAGLGEINFSGKKGKKRGGRRSHSSPYRRRGESHEGSPFYPEMGRKKKCLSLLQKKKETTSAWKAVFSSPIAEGGRGRGFFSPGGKVEAQKKKKKITPLRSDKGKKGGGIPSWLPEESEGVREKRGLS